jgi:hypothetical protein
MIKQHLFTVCQVEKKLWQDYSDTEAAAFNSNVDRGPEFKSCQVQAGKKFVMVVLGHHHVSNWSRRQNEA